MRIGVLGAAALLVAARGTAPIEIAVHGVDSARGLVHVDLCTEREFLKECRWAIDVPAVAGTTIVTIANVPPGRYAAQATHDANANHKVDRVLGLPTERVGFSNDAPVPLRPPRFADAAFVHGSTPQRIAFTLRRLP